MPYFVQYPTGHLPDDHPEEGFDLLADAALFARGVKGRTIIRRVDV